MGNSTSNKVAVTPKRTYNDYVPKHVYLPDEKNEELFVVQTECRVIEKSRFDLGDGRKDNGNRKERIFACTKYAKCDVTLKVMGYFNREHNDSTFRLIGTEVVDVKQQKYHPSYVIFDKENIISKFTNKVNKYYSISNITNCQCHISLATDFDHEVTGCKLKEEN